MDTIASSYAIPALLDRLGSPSAPLIIDVRIPTAFERDTHLIAGATWRDPFTINEWSKYLPRHRPVVVYCARGFEISRNTADALRTAGLDARALEGGIAGWREAGGPLFRKSSTPLVPSKANGPSVWVTRERPKIDRIACPWLIRRFIDPLAEFVYVPSGEVLSYAEQHHAAPYDVPGVTFTHRDEACSFDALLADFELRDGPLDDLATIVRGADSGKVELTPQSPGLLAISLGLSRLYADDHEMLAHGMTVYDALYAWLKGARNERHNADLFKKA
jgi:rhodanese-related sulfurtransferase